MKNSLIQNRKTSSRLLKIEYLLVLIFSLTALVGTFLVSNSDFSFENKLYVFSLIVAVYLISHTGIFFLSKKTILTDVKTVEISTENEIFTADIEEKLLVLEEANNFFGASLKSADMFRLVTSRVGQIVEFDAGGLFLVNEQSKLEGKFAVGMNSRLFENIELELNEGLAGKAFQTKKIITDGKLVKEKKCLPKEFLENLHSAAAVPLLRGGKVFGVLNLYSTSENYFDTNKIMLLEAVGERVAPLLSSSLSYEKSLANALTDNLTNLPNERAFYLVLENQIAEAQRFAERRSLTILAVDIKNFAELNQKYGHPTGDGILTLSAEIMKRQLRKMDFIARTHNDEFLIILPTATGEITEEIIQRIENAFNDKPFEIAENKNFEINLSFGAATFQNDGETAEQLLKIAKVRKIQSKQNGKNAVIFFPKQFVN